MIVVHLVLIDIAWVVAIHIVEVVIKVVNSSSHVVELIHIIHIWIVLAHIYSPSASIITRKKVLIIISASIVTSFANIIIRGEKVLNFVFNNYLFQSIDKSASRSWLYAQVFDYRLVYNTIDIIFCVIYKHYSILYLNKLL